MATTGGASARTTSRRGGPGRLGSPCPSRSVSVYGPDSSAARVTEAVFPSAASRAATGFGDPGQPTSAERTSFRLETFRTTRLPSHASIRAGSRAAAAGSAVYAGGSTRAETAASAGGSTPRTRNDRLTADPLVTRYVIEPASLGMVTEKLRAAAGDASVPGASAIATLRRAPPGSVHSSQ